MKAVIETHALSHHYGKKAAVRELNLSVPEGSVFALLGPNGAGKTTIIKLLLNLVEATEGRASILGVDSTRLGPAEMAQIGYVSENQQMPEWMTVQELIDFCRPMYRTWDSDFCAQMLRDFRLPADQKIRHLSRGMRMKLSLVTALAYRPRLLVLDEPFTGLDAVVRAEVIRGVLELTAQARWSVLVASHDLDEIERFADWIGFLDEGSLKVCEPTAQLNQRFKRLDCVVPENFQRDFEIPASWLRMERNTRALRVMESGYVAGESEARLRSLIPEASDLTATDLSLREIFVVLSQPFRNHT